MFLLLVYLLVATGPSLSSGVSVLNPLNKQLPPIAHINNVFSWSFSPNTFASSNGSVALNTSLLPGWLLFDPASLTFHGTPTAADEGSLDITVTARDLTSSASSSFFLCVTSYPPPVLLHSIQEQFTASNPALSSVFVLNSNSAIATSNPALRIPQKWSFSVGVAGDTFMSNTSLFYNALQANGSDLPSWMEFDTESITFNGLTPANISVALPHTVSLAIHASSEEGYSDVSLPFDFVIADHELYPSLPCLPTINITASTLFNLSLSSPGDFSGILIDGDPIQANNISSLSIDTSEYNWLQYDSVSRQLSGKPPDDFTTGERPLPVVVTASFNQSLRTSVSFAVFPSYFSASELRPLEVENGPVQFNLEQYYSNKTSGEVDLTATFSPSSAENYLNFDPKTAQMTGSLPANYSATISHITVTFTAYSGVTHSTSHAILPISLSVSDYKKSNGTSHLRNLSNAAHSKLVLALSIVFGMIGGISAVGVLLAAFRRCARVDDTALGDEAGQKVWTDNEKKWYGMDKRYGDLEKLRPGMDIENPFEPELATPAARGGPGYLGLGLQRISARTNSEASSKAGDPVNKPTSPGVMSKAEFFGRIKDTVRSVSDKARGKTKPEVRPTIGKPILLTPTARSKVEGLPFSSSASPSNPFEDIDPLGFHGGSITDSPSSSTGGRSIPRRRADFAPPRSPAQVHFEDEQLLRKTSTGSVNSFNSSSSTKTHAAEAVIQTAAKAHSIRSGKSVNSVSYEGPNVRPRLVPFTSATRVPIPQRSDSPTPEISDSSAPSLVTTKRVASQTAQIFRSPGGRIMKSVSGDELSVSMHYVRALGADQSTPSIATNVRSSFSSLESSHQGHGKAGGEVTRMLIRAGQKFKFRVPLTLEAPSSPLSPVYRKEPKLEVRLTSGKPMPKFMLVDLKGGRQKGGVEFTGVPTMKDIGEIDVSVYTTKDSACVGRVIVEVVGRS